jgi:alkylation response protein AidB-like acyl-CoA dehydrogenase
MDLAYTPEEEGFRTRVRTWLAANVPDTSKGYDLAQMKAWQRKLHAAGFLAVAWPKEYGGAASRSWSRPS